MKQPATKADKDGAWIQVPRETVAAVFKEHYPRGPQPTASHCYHLANAIDIVRNKGPLPVKNAIPGYRDRQKVFDAIFELVEKQIQNHKAYGAAQWPPLVQLEELRSRCSAPCSDTSSRVRVRPLWPARGLFMPMRMLSYLSLPWPCTRSDFKVAASSASPVSKAPPSP